MPFIEFLDANHLPYVAERVFTPSGLKVEVVRYIFDCHGSYVVVIPKGSDMEIQWTLDQLKQCTRKGGRC